jgi:muramoyltetrapeptide carboxypeptidase
MPWQRYFGRYGEAMEANFSAQIASRRQIIAGLTVLMASPASQAFQTPQRYSASSRKAGPRLRVGDTIGLIEPASGSDDAFEINLVEDAIRAMGLVPKRAPNVLKRYGYLAGQDRERGEDITAMYADKSVRAIFAVRGGWGSQRALPFVNWEIVRANPKFLLGYSDVTALHMAIAAQGGAYTLHGPNASSAWGKVSVAAFRDIAFDAGTPLFENPIATEDRLVQRRFRTIKITGGKAKGQLLGGNLSVLTSLIGTPYLPDFSGAILFLEEIDEAEYRIDRMLTQLGQAGILKKLSGVVFGQCTNCKVPGGYNAGGGFTLNALLQQHFGPLSIPAFEGSWFGHIADQFTIPQGPMAEMDADAGTLRLLEPAVA